MEEDMPPLEVKHLRKMYTTRSGGVKAEALVDVEFSVESGGYVAIMREFGSRETMLPNILTASDKPTFGSMMLDGQDMAKIPDGRMAAYRRDNLEFVFQDFNLLDTFSLKDNTSPPVVLVRKDYQEAEEHLAPLAAQLETGDLLGKYSHEVSGGQKQRVAVARVLIMRPRILLVDEPMGALDSRVANGLLRIFEQVNRSGQTVFMVTHSIRAANHAGWVLFIKDGIIFHQLYRGDASNETMYQEISDTLTVLATRRGEGGYEQLA